MNIVRNSIMYVAITSSHHSSELECPCVLGEGTQVIRKSRKPNVQAILCLV